MEWYEVTASLYYSQNNLSLTDKRKKKPHRQQRLRLQLTNHLYVTNNSIFKQQNATHINKKPIQYKTKQEQSKINNHVKTTEQETKNRTRCRKTHC